MLAGSCIHFVMDSFTAVSYIKPRDSHLCCCLAEGVVLSTSGASISPEGFRECLGGPPFKGQPLMIHWTFSEESFLDILDMGISPEVDLFRDCDCLVDHL